jgi:imidazolonepropionase-like amidohydrolase
LSGPTIFTSGSKIEGRGSIWPGDMEIGAREELNAALDRLQEWRADFVKITDDKLSPELFIDAVAEASRRGFKTSAHIPLGITVDEASVAGLRSIEHLSYAYRAGSPQEREIASQFRAGRLTREQASKQLEDTFDAATAIAAYKRLAARGTAITPTLNGSRVIAYLDQDDHEHDAYLKYIGPGLRATYAWRVERAAKDDAAAIRRRHERYERIAAILPLLQQAGVKILAGTDAGFLNSYNYPGIGLHQELALFVRAGLTPLQALQAATINGAEFMGRAATHGRIAAGKAADLVLLNANPLDAIESTQRIDAVVLRGELYGRAELDAMLQDVEARVAGQRAAR